MGKASTKPESPLSTPPASPLFQFVSLPPPAPHSSLGRRLSASSVASAGSSHHDRSAGDDGDGVVSEGEGDVSFLGEAGGGEGGSAGEGAGGEGQRPEAEEEDYDDDAAYDLGVLEEVDEETTWQGSYYEREAGEWFPGGVGRATGAGTDSEASLGGLWRPGAAWQPSYGYTVGDAPGPTAYSTEGLAYQTGAFAYASGQVAYPDGSVQYPDGSVVYPGEVVPPTAYLNRRVPSYDLSLFGGAVPSFFNPLGIEKGGKRKSKTRKGSKCDLPEARPPPPPPPPVEEESEEKKEAEMIDDQANANERLMASVMHKQLGLLRRLCSREDCDPNCRREIDGMTVLHACCKHGFSEVVTVLLGKGAEVDVEDAQGRTPLHLTALYGHAKTMNLLLEKKADIHLLDHDGCSALHHAASYGHTGCCSILLKAGSDPDLTDFKGKTALRIASQYAHFAAARVLVEGGANVDLADAKGVSPLRTTVQYGHFGTASLLLGAKCDVNLVDEKLRSPLRAASQVRCL